MVILCSSSAFVDAGRLLSDDFKGKVNGHFSMLPSAYDKAKVTMVHWLERLSPGPTHSGGGH
ncbi:hypothetical protein Ancab_010565 [Ancistrocladus abbreviatus]